MDGWTLFATIAFAGFIRSGWFQFAEWRKSRLLEPVAVRNHGFWTDRRVDLVHDWLRTIFWVWLAVVVIGGLWVVGADAGRWDYPPL